MGYYPLFVDLFGRACLVVGGGVIAEGKVQGLLTAGANVAFCIGFMPKGSRAGVARDPDSVQQERNSDTYAWRPRHSS